MAQPSVPQAKFKVLKALGKGSYGTVYKVQRLADGGVYAMKETDLGRMGQKERADAVNEIRVLGSINHPNVVRYHETFLSGNKLCIVMEFAPAGDLASFIKAASASQLPLPEATVWQILLQLCQGMQSIHETAVIHRDLKPANIFMCQGNVVKVGDLGVAKALTKAHYAQTTIGTPVFMAPEVWRGLKYGYSSDLWSLGGVLYEIMTYRLPFNGRSLPELKNRIILGSFTPLTPGAPYSPALVTVCHALLNKDPRKRPTCAAILNSTEAAPWLHTIPESVRMPLPALDAVPSVAHVLAAPAAGGANVNPQLMPTIHVPHDIRLLPHRLPKPCYDEGTNAPGAQQPQQPEVWPAGGQAPLPHNNISAAPMVAPVAAAMAAAMSAAAAAGGRGAMGVRAPSPRQAAAAAAVGAAVPSPRNYVPVGGYVSPMMAAAAAAGAAAQAGRVPSAGVRPPSGAGGAVPRTPPGVFRVMAGKSPAAAGQQQQQQRVLSAKSRVAAAALAGAGAAAAMQPSAAAAIGAKYGGIPSAAAGGVASRARVMAAAPRRHGFY